MGEAHGPMTTHDMTTRHRIRPFMKRIAGKLRREMSQPERVLWQLLRRRNLDGLKFRRQAVIGPYVVDFLCPSNRMIVEVDGESHVGRQREDEARTTFLECKGFRVVRVTNDDVLRDLDAVGLMILQHASAPPTPQPPPSEGGGARAQPRPHQPHQPQQPQPRPLPL